MFAVLNTNLEVIEVYEEHRHNSEAASKCTQGCTSKVRMSEETEPAEERLRRSFQVIWGEKNRVIGPSGDRVK